MLPLMQLVTDEMIEFFMNNRFHITISLDGPIEIHDENEHFNESGLKEL